MKNLILLTVVCSIVSSRAFSQTVYLTDTAFTTDVGFGGAPASCVFTGGSNTGYWMDNIKGYSLADVFTVPFSSTWLFDTVILYGYQNNSTTTSPFTAAYLEIFQGTPGSGGTVMWGDMTINLLASTGFTGIYRVDTTLGLNYTALPIMYLKLHLSSPPVLSANTYWLHWSTEASGTSRINCPPRVLPGRINPSGQQGRQDSSGTWVSVSNNSNHLGFSKIIKASAGLSVPNIQNQVTSLLSQNTPNPCYEETSISFDLPQQGNVKLSVYDNTGKVVSILVNGYLNKGIHQTTFHANQLPSGIYYYQLCTSTGVETRRMLLAK